MNVSRPYTINASYISASTHTISGSGVSTYTYKWSNYDDTKVLSYINDLQNEVNDIERDFASKQWVENQGYLTEHQDLSSYATMNWVENQGYLTEHQDLSSYTTFEDISSMSYTSPLTSEQMNALFPLEINQ